MWRGRTVGIVDVEAVWFIHLPSRLAPERASCATRHVSVACGGEALLRTVARRVLVPLSSPRLSPSAISRFDRSVSVVVVVIDVIPDRIVLPRCVIIRGMELETHRLQSQEKKRPQPVTRITVRLSSNTENKKYAYVSFLSSNEDLSKKRAWKINKASKRFQT